MKKLLSFEEALERYQNARKTMNLKEKLKRQLPPIGSAFYRYYSDSNTNPPSYYELCNRIDDMTLEECKNHPEWQWTD
tara:strand:+ start:53 stop:286 length:234 start_codon:yes stop_codon:yes gene_type:complete